MKRDVAKIGPIQSSFLSVEKDIDTIIKKLFIQSRPYSDELKSLLVINTKDCLDNINCDQYQTILKNTSMSQLVDNGYINVNQKIYIPEHEEVKSYIVIKMDNFYLNNSNPEFRDSQIIFDIICHTDYWDLGNYRMRPLKIAGYIDGILNKTKLSGIGKLLFENCFKITEDEHLSGYSLIYQAVHGSDDKIPGDD